MEAHYNFNIYNSLILAGIVQGLIFGAIVAFSKKYNSTATLILAALVVVFSLNNLQYYLTNTWLIRNRYGYGIVWTPGQLVMGPLLYFYGLKLLHPENKIPRKTVWLLLTPFIIGLIAVNCLKISCNYLDHKSYYLLLEAVIEFASIVFTITLLVRLFFMARTAQKEMQDFDPLKVLPKLQWFINILIAFFVLCLIWFGVTLNMVISDAPQEVWYAVWISLSAMIYWIGHIGIYKYGVQEERKKIRNYSIENRADFVAQRKNDHIATLENLIAGRRLFLDSTLTLDRVADELNLSKSHVSRIINSELGMGFPDYLNSLRVAEAKLYLSNPEFSNYTLVAIGLEAGFNSKTTFNNTFKKLTGMTPSEYKNRAR